MLGREIADGRKRLKLSQTAFAKRLGVSRGSVHLWETNRGMPTKKHKFALAKLLGMDVEEMEPMPTASAEFAVEAGAGVPVFRTVPDGSSGLPWVWRVTGEVVDMVNAPQPLRHRRDLRALQVPTDHMAPRYFAGEMIWISQARMAVEGDFVVLMRNGEPSDGEPATLGRIVKLTPAHVEIEQYKPSRTYKIARKQIGSIWRIVPPAEFG